MRSWGYAVTVGLLVTGCGVQQDGGAQPSASKQASPSSSASSLAAVGPSCTEVSKALLAAINRAVQEKGAENSLPEAVALQDEKSGMWLVTGAFKGSAAEGEGALGTWATEGDVTSSSFNAPLFAVDGGAEVYSSAPKVKNRITRDPAGLPVIGCWTSPGWRTGKTS